MTTTIRIRRETKRKLENIGRKNESFDDIINEILHERNFHEIQEYTNENSEDLLKETIRVFDVIKYIVPENINLKGVLELVEDDGYNTYAEAIIEAYCMIEDIFSPN